jgi:membrane associated rhomboid family serine protease
MFNDLKNDIIKGGALTLLIAFIILIYLITGILPVLMSGSGAVDFYIHEYFAFPASWQRFIHHPWSIITYSFFHAGVFHVAFNMIALFFFGDILQDFIGRKHIIPVFTFGVIGGAILFFLFYNLFPFFKSSVPNADLIGASAGVMGILLAATTITPNLPIGFLIWRNMQLKYVAVIFVLIDLLSIISTNAGGHIAHLGGALAGWFYIRQLQNGVNLGSWWQFDFSKMKNRKKFQVHRNDDFKLKPTQNTRNDNEQRLNKILDKISASGYESLTDEEKSFLEKYNEQ